MEKKKKERKIIKTRNSRSCNQPGRVGGAGGRELLLPLPIPMEKPFPARAGMLGAGPWSLSSCVLPGVPSMLLCPSLQYFSLARALGNLKDRFLHGFHTFLGIPQVKPKSIRSSFVRFLFLPSHHLPSFFPVLLPNPSWIQVAEIHALLLMLHISARSSADKNYLQNYIYISIYLYIKRKGGRGYYSVYAESIFLAVAVRSHLKPRTV